MATLTDNGEGGYTLEFKQGQTEVFHKDIYKDETLAELEDLTGYSARGMARQSYGTLAKYPELFPINCTVSDGRVTCTILPADSAANTTIIAGVWDVELYATNDSTIVYRILEGSFSMSQEATI